MQTPTAEVLVCTTFGGPEVLRVIEADLPPLAPDEVRYDVHAFALNRADLMFLRGEHYTIPSFPSRIGQEASGTVTEVGAAVTRFAVGDRVSALPFYTQQHGVQGRSAVTPEAYLAHLPDEIDFIQGASIWMQYLTSWFAFNEAVRLQRGDSVLVTAAASSAGLGSVQIARMLNLRTIATVRSAAKEGVVREQGAHAVVVTGRDDLAAVIDGVTGGLGINAAFDPIGGDSLFDYADSLARGATVLGYGTLSDAQPIVPVAPMVRAHATFHPYSMFNHVADLAQRERAVEAIHRGLVSGTLRPVVDRVFAFAEFRDAYRYMESNAGAGKVVVSI